MMMTRYGPYGENDDRVSMLYGFLSSGSADKAAGLFAPDGVYAHTGERTVKASTVDAMQLFLEAMISKGAFNGSENYKVESDIEHQELADQGAQIYGAMPVAGGG
jgi:hypothetical protein